MNEHLSVSQSEPTNQAQGVSDIAEVSELAARINRHISRSDFKSIDADLYYAQPDDKTPVMALALARCTFAVKRKLANWDDYVARVRESLISRGQPNVDRLMKGLGTWCQPIANEESASELPST